MDAAHLGHLVKDKELVVVASARKLALVAPLQAADFLPMHRELMGPVILDAHIAMQDEAVMRAGCEDVVVPGEGADWFKAVSFQPGSGVKVTSRTSCRMSRHLSYAPSHVRIPDLDHAALGPDCDLVALRREVIVQPASPLRRRSALTR